MVRVRGSCTRPRGAGRAVDGGCDAFCDDLGDSRTRHDPALFLRHHVSDPHLTSNWATPLS